MSYISSSQIDQIMNDEVVSKNLLGEEGINFIIDNYFETLSMYRLIIKEEKKVLGETEELRSIAKDELDRIRKQSEQRRKTKVFLTEREKIELHNEKEYLKKMLETDGSREIIYKNKILQATPVVLFVIDNRKIIKTIEAIDQKIRDKAGPIAGSIVKVVLWPTIKLIKLARKINRNRSAGEQLEVFYNHCKYLHINLRHKIETPV